MNKSISQDKLGIYEDCVAKILSALLIASVIFMFWHANRFENYRENIAVQLVSTAGYQNIKWESTQYGFMFSVKGCGFFSPSKLTTLQAKRGDQDIKLSVCEWEYIHDPIVVEE